MYTIYGEIKINSQINNNVEVQLQNSTNRTWYLGGWRFNTNKNTFTSVEGNGYLVCKNDAQSNGYIHTTQSTTVAPIWATKISPNSLFTGRSAGYGSGNGYNISKPYILLKTSSFGVPEMPTDEPAITLDQLDSLIMTNNYYNESYRYIDSLGRRGGRYSGGFLDTWYGETQIQFPYNGLDVGGASIVANNSNYLYWLALAMGQEYLNVDMQWMIGFGVKETWSGTSVFGAPFNTNTEGAYGPFEVETNTGVDRALAYYTFFPEYINQFSNAPDVTTLVNNGFNKDAFMGEYMESTTFYLDSATVVNGYVFSIVNQFSIYGFFSYAEDFCWKEVLDGAADKTYGLCAVAIAYNLGVYSGDLATITTTMNKDNWQTTNLDPNATSMFPTGNSNYTVAIRGVVMDKLIPRSVNAFSDPNIKLWDYQISWNIIERFFLGEGGTALQQGRGGLLKHYNTSDIELRKDIMNTLSAAFNKLKGKAPGSTSSTISFRYDWLALLRTVKQYFDNSGLYLKPAGGDIAQQISNNSNIGGCEPGERDTLYPYANIISKIYNNDFIAEVNTNDNKGIKEVKWTINSNWEFWQNATYQGGTGTNQIFKIVVPKQQIQNQYGSGSGKLWYMVTDENGNSIVRDIEIEGDVKSPLKSAAAIDADGDGKADTIHVHILEEAILSPDDKTKPDLFKYSWPQQNVLIPVVGENYNSGLFTFSPYNKNGDGKGTVEIKYPSMNKSFSIDILDSIGPAITNAEYKEGENKLTIFLTESINDISGNVNVSYLKINGSVIEQSSITKGVNDLTWTFILKDKISKGDKISLVHNTGIVDISAQKNPPKENNKEIEVIMFSDLLKVEKLLYKDVDANGKMDQVLFTFDKSIQDISKLSFLLTWLDDNNNLDTIIINGSDLVSTSMINEFLYSISITQSIKSDLTFIENNSSYGDVVVIQKKSDSDEIDTSLNSIEKIDGMSPVIISADYFNFKGAKVDEIVVVLSEDVSVIQTKEPFSLYGNNGKYVLQLEKLSDTVIGQVNPTIKIIFKKNMGKIPEVGDSININVNAYLTDNSGNVQNVNENKHVLLNIISAIGITEVSYHEKLIPYDGYIDIIKIRTDTTLKEDMFQKIKNELILNSDRYFEQLELSSFSLLNGEYGFQIDVKQKIGSTVNTSVNKEDLFILKNEIKASSGFIMYDTIQIKDSLSPVIVSSFYYPAEITKNNYQSLVPDTLNIKFSEYVDFDKMKNNPFNYKRNDGSGFRIDLNKENCESNYAIKFLVDYNSDKPRNGDSIQIEIKSDVQDTNNNIQRVDNIYVPIEVNPVPYHWNVKVYPNPIFSSNSNQNELKKKNLATYLQISDNLIKDDIQAIILDPFGPAPNKNEVTISISIFDAVGNIILKDKQLSISENGEIWYFLWDCKNSLGRKVGSGVYFCKIKTNHIYAGYTLDPILLGVGK